MHNKINFHGNGNKSHYTVISRGLGIDRPAVKVPRTALTKWGHQRSRNKRSSVSSSRRGRNFMRVGIYQDARSRCSLCLIKSWHPRTRTIVLLRTVSDPLARFTANILLPCLRVYVLLQIRSEAYIYSAIFPVYLSTPLSVVLVFA